MDHRLRLGKAACRALRVLRPGGEAVFPETTVHARHVFKLVETLYGLTIELRCTALAPDVRFYSIRDRSGILVGQFYADLYARPSKRGGAWMDEAVGAG